jgi:hypothetical protein
VQGFSKSALERVSTFKQDAQGKAKDGVGEGEEVLKRHPKEE